MKPHHEKAALKAKERLLQQYNGILGIFVAGSIAKGQEREDSDVDLIVVVNDHAYKQLEINGNTSFLWHDLCDYKNGYVEGMIYGGSIIEHAVHHASEPTRNAFIGCFPIYKTNDDIENTVRKIPVYPEHGHDEKIFSFVSQLQLWRWFFWHEGDRRKDLYLKHHAASQMVLFGCRLILAQNRVIFACQKRLMEQVCACENKPNDIVALIEGFLSKNTFENKEKFCQTIIDFGGWGKFDGVKLMTRFQRDTAYSWILKTHDVAEW